MVELESEGELTRDEVADFLREFAEELENASVDRSQEPIIGEDDEEFEARDDHQADRITFIVGGDSATVSVPEMIDFEVEVGSRSPMLSSGVSQAVEFDLSWELEEQDEELHGDGIEIE